MEKKLTEHKTDKNIIQEQEYEEPYHWKSENRVEYCRYNMLSKFLVHQIMDICICHQSESVQIFDVGCGDGRSSYSIWKNLCSEGFDVELTGCDISSKAIKWAEKFTKERSDSSLQFYDKNFIQVVQNATESKKITFLILREVIEHLKEEEIDKIVEGFKSNFSGGFVLITTPSQNSPVAPKHYRHYTPRMLKEICRRNDIDVLKLTGFAYRPRFLYWPLMYLKILLNKILFLWRLMSICWREVAPKNAITLVALGKTKGK